MNGREVPCGRFAAAATALALASCVVVDADFNPNAAGAAGTTSALDGRPTTRLTPNVSATPGSPASPTPKPPPTPAPPISMAADAWEPQVSGVTSDLHAIVAKGIKNARPWAWAVGDGGTILRTSDGGDSWQKLPAGTPQHLYAVNYFWQPVPGVTGSESYTVAVGGAGGTLLLSTDSGATWLRLPAPVATDSADPAGDIRQLDIWPTQAATGEKSRGRTAIFVSSARYPLIMTPNASDATKVVWDEQGAWGGTNAYPIAYRDALSWPLSLTSADARFRFSFYSVRDDRAYGLLLARDKARVGFCPDGVAFCIGYPASLNGDWPWRWRPSQAVLGIEGEPTDIAMVPDNDRETSPCGDVSGYVAYMSTTRAIYRSADYGETWMKILAAGADRLIATGGRQEGEEGISFGTLTAVSATRIWHGRGVYPPAPPPPAKPCPKGEPTFEWIQVLRGSEIDLAAEDSYLGGVRSTDTGFYRQDLWLVGKGGRIYRRTGG